MTPYNLLSQKLLALTCMSNSAILGLQILKYINKKLLRPSSFGLTLLLLLAVWGRILLMKLLLLTLLLADIVVPHALLRQELLRHRVLPHLIAKRVL